ncbi:ATP-binding protein [Thiomicrorhabdus xiamenensis]|uniref:histidine kinase n=1 Tax=Thiomicrorhabdus xiamenensis TaxID=2739063 RepID=A0A7D4NKD3_9GAMM|nr:ATP-binding protein [Thiomicrorhabdus xiamenensis]QKI89149.1 sensor histidine kinase [Thiomicrorhabdus xiamenensis]
MFRFIQKNYRLSIRDRLFILLLLLTILPFLAYRFAIDLHRIMLNNQAIVQQQTVENLALILENRTDLWALQIQSGKPTRLSHLNLNNSVLWVVNEYGQTTYVVGKLPDKEENPDTGFFTTTGKLLIKTLATFIPYSLPYPYPQSPQPEITLIRHSLNGQTLQQYRMDSDGNPVSLMSATPLMVQNRIIGSLVLEQRMETLFSDSLNYFYRLIGIGAAIFFIVIVGAIIHTASLSNRIIRLDDDVKKTFDLKGRLTQLDFPDRQSRIYQDELSDLRHHIYEMLKQLGSYERYLKQLPKTLRHELHNPLNRLSMALTLLEKETEHHQLDYAKHALTQLKQIIASLSEATSIEDSLHSQQPEAFPIGLMLRHYIDNILVLHPDYQISSDLKLDDHVQLLGDGFMIEQMMDKLLSNANDFSDGKMPIRIRAAKIGSQIEIRVENSGPPLPKGHEKQIFDGMTSMRALNQGQAHLGLGLHIVKLIVDFHQGSVSADNSQFIYKGQNLSGVSFKILLPIHKLA